MEEEDEAKRAPDSYINPGAGRAYWQAVEADVNGMLGGIPAVSQVDLQGSRAFLARLGIGRKPGLRRLRRVLEGGAGIGRVTEGLLMPVADVVDVVEPIAKFTERIRGREGVGKVYNVGLEEWEAEAGAGYDLFWNQWCLGHLRDDQLVRYLGRCAASLSGEEGLVVVKENITGGEEDLFDELDSSVTRRDDKFRQLFDQAGLEIVRTEVQRAMPKELFPVRMYALRRRGSAGGRRGGDEGEAC